MSDSYWATTRRTRWLPLLCCQLAMLAGCSSQEPDALGTLEYDRITLPAPVAERIVAVTVVEGQMVRSGAHLLSLESTRTAAETDAAQAALQQQRAALAELQAGSRSEEISQAREALASAVAQAQESSAYYTRLATLGQGGVVSAADLDRARATAQSRKADVRHAQAALTELQNGSRKERIAQAQSAARAAAATLAAQQSSLDKLDIVAPRDGRVDSLPYKLGDQAPLGAPLAILLVGDRPYARIYIKENWRARLAIGARVSVSVEGRSERFTGQLRMIRSDPVFTPYYALTGKDAARLSYLAEVQLDAPAVGLPAGLPVSVKFAASE